METLQSGPSRPPVWERVPAKRRALAVVLVALVLGVVVGAGVTVWRQSEPEPATFRPDEHAVELVLFQELPSHSSERSLHVDGALLLAGLVTSTVVAISASGSGLGVRISSLPVTVSPTRRFQEVALAVVVRDCKAAMAWTPRARPFVIAWRDEYGREHMDRAGDFGPSMAESLTRHIDAACDEPTRATGDSDR
jgi:hypothetical protein